MSRGLVLLVEDKTYFKEAATQLSLPDEREVREVLERYQVFKAGTPDVEAPKLKLVGISAERVLGHMERLAKHQGDQSHKAQLNNCRSRVEVLLHSISKATSDAGGVRLCVEHTEGPMQLKLWTKQMNTPGNEFIFGGQIGRARLTQYFRLEKATDPNTDVADVDPDTPCEVCSKPDADWKDNAMLVCDACNTCWHQKCLSPPLHQVPQGDWLCGRCVSSNQKRGSLIPPNVESTKCEVCQSPKDPPVMLLCDSCDKGWHMKCLDPPMTRVPKDEEWFCKGCQAMMHPQGGPHPMQAQAQPLNASGKKRPGESAAVSDSTSSGTSAKGKQRKVAMKSTGGAMKNTAGASRGVAPSGADSTPTQPNINSELKLKLGELHTNYTALARQMIALQEQLPEAISAGSTELSQQMERLEAMEKEVANLHEKLETFQTQLMDIVDIKTQLREAQQEATTLKEEVGQLRQEQGLAAAAAVAVADQIEMLQEEVGRMRREDVGAAQLAHEHEREHEPPPQEDRSEIVDKLVEKLAEAQRAHAEELEQRKQAQVEVERLSSANQAQANQLMQLAMSDGTGAVLPATREDPYYNLILQLQQENSELRQREARAQGALVATKEKLAHAQQPRVTQQTFVRTTIGTAGGYEDAQWGQPVANRGHNWMLASGSVGGQPPPTTHNAQTAMHMQPSGVGALNGVGGGSTLPSSARIPHFGNNPWETLIPHFGNAARPTSNTSHQ